MGKKINLTLASQFSLDVNAAEFKTGGKKGIILMSQQLSNNSEKHHGPTFQSRE